MRKIIKYVSLFILNKKKRKTFRTKAFYYVALAADVKKIRKNKQAIVFKNQSKPLVSILIPVYNQYQLTIDCLRSIMLNTGDVDYEVIIADDNSTDETTNINQVAKNITVIKNKTNLGFLKNVNNAAQHAKGEYIFLMNNDMIVRPNWLQPLLNVFADKKDAGIAASKMLKYDGTIMEFGSHIYKDGSTSWAGCDKKNDLSNQSLKEVDFSSGCALLFKKSSWDKLKGFDTEFMPAYYEDADFCFRIKYNLGLKIYVEPKSEIYHFHSQTYSAKSRELILTNRKKFAKRWAKELEDYKGVE